MKTKQKVVQRQSAPSSRPIPANVADSPLFGVAMLKIAMELKKANSPALEDILSGVLSNMKLSEEAFRTYLAQNGGLLRTIAQKREY